MEGRGRGGKWEKGEEKISGRRGEEKGEGLPLYF